MIRTIDEVTLPNEYDNNLSDFVKYFEEYYSKVPASKERRENRRDAAEELRDVIIIFLLLLRLQIENGAFNYDYLLNTFRNDFERAVGKFVTIDEYMSTYIKNETQMILDNTLNNLDNPGYYLSEDRATIDAANEGSIVINYAELQKAIDEGKTKKKWKTSLDNKVRPTHAEVEGKTIPIEDYFIVGGCAMMMPHDPECENMKEVANCR